MTDHPITPPPELVYEWAKDRALLGDPTPLPEYIATRATQWGADRELEACCEWLRHEHTWKFAHDLRYARRPKPPSLKNEAIGALLRFMADDGHDDCSDEVINDDFNIIRRALEALPDD